MSDHYELAQEISKISAVRWTRMDGTNYQLSPGTDSYAYDLAQEGLDAGLLEETTHAGQYKVVNDDLRRLLGYRSDIKGYNDIGKPGYYAFGRRYKRPEQTQTLFDGGRRHSRQAHMPTPR